MGVVTISEFFNNLKINKKEFFLKHFLCFFPVIIYSICSICYPSFIHLIIDYGVAAGNTKLIIIYCSSMTIVGLVMVISDYFIKIIYYKFSISFTIDLKKKLFIKILNSKFNISSQKKVGDLFTCLNSDLERISDFLTCEMPNILKNLLTFLGVSIFVIYYFGIFGVLIILFSLCSILFQNKLGKKILLLSENVRHIVGVESSYTTEVLSNLEDIQMSGYISLVCNQYTANNLKLKKSTIDNNKIIYLSGSLGYLINTMMLLFIIAIGSFGTQNGILEIGTLFSMTIYAQRIVGPVVSLISSYIEMKNTYPLFNRVQTLLQKAENLCEGHLHPVDDLKEIIYENISFCYPIAKRKLFNNFNLVISDGDIVGVVGHNGIGKSTLIKLLFQLCIPDKGKISINNTFNLRDIKLDYLYENIGYLGQFPFLFSGKLIDIINPLHKNISNDEILKILQEINLDINLFDNSLDFVLSENSTNISGGEKQKLAIARLIIENKKWLLLDEPTSSMDAESEKIVCEYLKKICLNKTALIITHRPEILGICNKIIDLNCL